MESIVQDVAVKGNPGTIPIYWTLTILLGAISILYSVLHMYKSKVGKQMSLIPGPRNYPFIGLVPYVMKYYYNNRLDIMPFLKDLRNEYGSVFGGYFGHQPAVFLGSHSAAATLLRSKETIKPDDYQIIHSILGDSIFLSQGDKWRHRRRMVTPAINSNRVFTLSNKFMKQARVLTTVLGEEAADKNTYFNLEPYLARCFLDISFDGVLGTDIESQKKRDSTIVHAFENLLGILSDRFFKLYLRPTFIWVLSGKARTEKITSGLMRGFMSEIIEKRKKMERTENHLVDLLIDWKDSEGIGLPNEDIIDETLTSLTGGRDTSTRGALFTLWLLAIHPEEYKKVVTELDEFLVLNGGDLAKVQSEDLKYLECCIKEAMRLFPPFPLFARKLQEDLHLEDKTIIPKGVECSVLTILVHRDPKVFPDPDLYKPERFLVEPPPFAFLAFSAGRRNCIGQKFGSVAVKTVVAQVLAEFTISTYKTMEDVKFTYDLLLKPSEPIPFQLTTRRK